MLEDIHADSAFRHAQYLSHKTHQESLTTLNQGLADLCERLAYSSSTVTPLSEEDRSIPVEVSSEIRQATSFWETNNVQSAGLKAQLTHVVQNTFTSVLEEQREKHGIPSATSEICLIPHARSVSKRSGRRVLHSSSKVTRTILGEMHCTVTTFQIIEPSRQSDLEQSDSKERLEIETNFSLVPSWLVVKFGLARVFKFDIMQLSSQGWQAKMATFNVRIYPLSAFHEDNEAPDHGSPACSFKFADF